MKIQPNPKGPTMSSIWDDPELKVNDDYVKFDNVGDTVTGTIVTIRAHRFDDGKVVPQVLLDVAGEERTMTAGQVRLKAELAEQRPEAGDTITVTLSEVEKRAGGKTLKHFDVKVTRGGGVAPTPVQPVPAADDQSAATAAALANLSPEQKAALGLPA